MEQLEQNQASLRVDMDSVKGNMEEFKDKMDQLTRAITNMMAREAEIDKRKLRFTLVDGNPLQGFTSDTQGDLSSHINTSPAGQLCGSEPII